MSKRNIFDFLENAEENEIEIIERMTPELSEEQFERILKMSVAKKGSMRKEKENDKYTEISEVEVRKISVWKRFSSVAALFVLIAGSVLMVGHFITNSNQTSVASNPPDISTTSVSEVTTDMTEVVTTVSDNDISEIKEPHIETLINEYFESVISISSFNENIYVSGNMISEKSFEFRCTENDIGITSENEHFVFGNKYDSGVLVLDKESNIVNEIPFIKERNGYIWKACVNKSGDIYYIEENFSRDLYWTTYEYRNSIAPDAPNTYIVHCITADGSHSSFEVPVHENAVIAESMEVDTSGNILIIEVMNDVHYGDTGTFKGSLYLSSYDKNGNLNGTYELKDCDDFWRSFSGGDGDAIFVEYKSRNFSTTFIKVKQSAEGIDVDIEYQHEKENTSDVLYNVDICMTGNDEYDMFAIYYSDTIGRDTMVYGIDLENNQKTEILDLSGFVNNMGRFEYYAGGKFWWSEYEYTDGYKHICWKSVSINQS